MDFKKELGYHYWPFIYSLPCHRGNLDNFLNRVTSKIFLPYQTLDGNKSQIATGEYFFGPHNQIAYDKGFFPHMVIPYDLKDRGEIKPDFLNRFPLIPEELHKIELQHFHILQARIYGIIAPDQELYHGNEIFVHRDMDYKTSEAEFIVGVF